MTEISTPEPAKLKKMNMAMSIISAILFLMALLIVFGTKFENSSPGNKELDFWIEGLGNIVLFTIHLLVNGVVCLICFFILLFTAIAKKALGNKHTIINLILLFACMFLPFMVLLR